MEERIGWRGQNESQTGGEEKRNGRLVWCCRDQQRACKMAQASAEKLEHTGPAEKKRVASVTTERAVGKNAGVTLVKRKRNQSCQSKAPDHEGRERGGSEQEHGEERVGSMVNKGSFQG